jgi:hypothetical protein
MVVGPSKTASSCVNADGCETNCYRNTQTNKFRGYKPLRQILTQRIAGDGGMMYVRARACSSSSCTGPRPRSFQRGSGPIIK